MALIDLSSLPPLSSKRLLMRQPSYADIDAICTLANDWEVAKWMSRLPFPYLREDAVFFLEKVIPQEAAWMVQGRESAEVLGVAGLNPHEASGTAELGYWFGSKHWGNGFATEASRAILEYAFGPASLPEVISGYFSGNARSAHVLEKLGFHAVGTDLRFCMAQARELSHVNLILTREAWNLTTGRS